MWLKVFLILQQKLYFIFIDDIIDITLNKVMENVLFNIMALNVRVFRLN